MPDIGLHCIRCGQLIPDRKRPGVAEEVTGLRVNRTGGGANQIKDWKGRGRWVCQRCLPLGDIPASDPLF